MMIPLLDWIPRKTLVLALGLSAGISIGSLILAPVVIARLPANYFLERPRHPRETSWDPRRPLHFALAVLKNLLGVALIVIGVAMVPFPGQGLLTMVVGIGLVDFPGKQRLSNAIVRRPMVLRSLNWVRIKARKAPFSAPAAA